MTRESWKYEVAKDHNLKFSERVASYHREPSVFSGFVRTVFWFALWLIMRTYHRFKIEGREKLPDGPFVMIANHSSHLDVVSLMLALSPSLRGRTFPLAAADHFFDDKPTAAFAAFAINALPLSRRGGGKGMQTLESIRERVLEQRCGIILFPEGTRSRDGRLNPFKPGIGLLVGGTEIPVVPCYIDGAFAAFPASAKFPLPRPVKVIIGEPLVFSSLSNGKEDALRIAEVLREAVAKLSTNASPSWSLVIP